jgi:hypothetical protein
LSENALPLQIVTAFVTDLLMRALKHCGGFKGNLYEFVALCRDLWLSPLERMGELKEPLRKVALLLGFSQTLPVAKMCSDLT